MGQAAHGHQETGAMDIADQKNTFSGFLTFTTWGTALIVMSVACLTVAFAMGNGWFAGVAVYAVLGVAAGLLLRMSGAWWASLIGAVVLFLIGGGVVAGLSALIGG